MQLRMADAINTSTVKPVSVRCSTVRYCATFVTFEVDIDEMSTIYLSFRTKEHAVVVLERTDNIDVVLIYPYVRSK